MARSVIGSLRVLLGLDAGEFDREARRASKRADKFGKSLRRALSFAAAGVAVQQLTRRTQQAVKSLDAIAKTADKIGVTTKTLQELRFAASQTGVETRTMELALQRFVRRTAEAAEGTGEAQDALEKLGIQLRTADGRLRSADKLLTDTADALANVEDQGERVRLAFKLFDSEGVAFLNTLQKGSAALNAMRQEARDAGIVIREDVIRNAEEMNNKLDLASKVVDAQLNTALADLAPLLVDATEGFAALAKAVGAAAQSFKDVQDASGSELERRIARVRQELERLQEFNVRGGFFTFGFDRQADRVKRLQNELDRLNAEKVRRDLIPAFEALRPKIEAARDIIGDIQLSPTFFQQIEDAGVEIGRLFGLVDEAAAKSEAITLPTRPREKPSGLGDERDALEGRLDRLRAVLDGEIELERQAAQRKHEILREGLESDLVSRQEFNRRRIQIEEQFDARVRELAERRQRLHELFMEQQKKTAIRSSAQVLSVVGQHIEELHFLQQAQAVANTIMRTYESVQAALTVPPPTGWIMAGINAAAGAANIASIAATSINSKSASPSVPGGGGGGAAAAGAGTQAQGAPTGGQVITVNITGDSNREAVLGLLDDIQDALDDGARLNVQGAS